MGYKIHTKMVKINLVSLLKLEKHICVMFIIHVHCYSLSVRVIIFSIVWVLTMGKHHFWIFPNLTEDCGVIESFKPFIKHDVYDSTKELKEKAKKKRLEKEEAELEEEENDSENENDKNNGFEMISGQEENNDREMEENLDEDGENEEEDEEEIGSDEIETKKDK